MTSGSTPGTSIQHSLQLSSAGQGFHIGSSADKVALDKDPGHGRGSRHLSKDSLDLTAILSVLDLDGCVFLANLIKFLENKSI